MSEDGMAAVLKALAELHAAMRDLTALSIRLDRAVVATLNLEGR